MKLRIQSELTKDQIMPALEHLRKHTKFFQTFSNNALLRFQEHFKFVAFREKAQLTRRGEPIDFLGFLIRGSAQGIIDAHSKIIIHEGDCIGYMAALKLQGCEVQQIDYFAKEDGYMAFIKLDDLRLLTKRDMAFASFFFRQLCLLNLDSISNQFLGRPYTSLLEESVIETSTKKVLHMLDTLGVVEVEEPVQKKKGEEVEEPKDFRYYWNQLEQRDKRIFVQCSSTVEIMTQQILARTNQPGNVFYIVLNGELVEFDQARPGRIYKMGQTIGLKEFLTNQSYTKNILGRCKCLLLRVTQSNYEDIANLSGATACALLSMLTRYESQVLRNEFEMSCVDVKQRLTKEIVIKVDELKSELKPLSKKDQQTTNQLVSNYFEIDTSKVKTGAPQEKSLDKSLIAPLYLLDSYKDLVSKRAYQSNEVKDRKDPMFISGLSIFLRDKLNEQRTQAQKQKELARKAKKTGKLPIQEEAEVDIHLDQQQDIFEELNNDYYHIAEERDKFRELVFLLEERIKQMQEDQKQFKEEYQKMQTQMRKMEMHKELLQLDLAAQLLQPTDKTLKKKITLFDNYLQQANENKKYQKTVRVAEKVLTLSSIHKSQY